MWSFLLLWKNVKVRIVKEKQGFSKRLQKRNIKKIPASGDDRTEKSVHEESIGNICKQQCPFG